MTPFFGITPKEWEWTVVTISEIWTIWGRKKHNSAFGHTYVEETKRVCHSNS